MVDLTGLQCCPLERPRIGNSGYFDSSVEAVGVSVS